MSETHKEQIARVEMAASDRDTWDLSDNDVLALKAVLEDRRALLEALRACMELARVGEAPAVVTTIRYKDLIAKVEGRT